MHPINAENGTIEWTWYNSLHNILNSITGSRNSMWASTILGQILPAIEEMISTKPLSEYFRNVNHTTFHTSFKSNWCLKVDQRRKMIIVAQGGKWPSKGIRKLGFRGGTQCVSETGDEVWVDRLRLQCGRTNACTGIDWNEAHLNSLDVVDALVGYDFEFGWLLEALVFTINGPAALPWSIPVNWHMFYGCVAYKGYALWVQVGVGRGRN